MDIISVLKLLGGMAFFLYGMSTMGTGLKKLAGAKMEMILYRLSSNPYKGFLLGILVTAVIQSSSATTVMAISFVNAGVMKVSQSIGIVLGACIGTTMTGWILSLSGSGAASSIFSVATITAVLALIGIIMRMFFHKDSYKHLGTILLGLAVLLSGMQTISAAVAPLKTNPDFIGILTLFSNPVLSVLAGIVVGGVTQSCSAGVGILQALSVTGVFSYHICLPLILGINIGASSPIILAMIDSGKNGRRTAFVYIYQGFIALLALSAIYYPLRAFGAMKFMSGIADMEGIAILNTTMRIVASVFMLPFHKFIEKLLYKTIKYDPSEDSDIQELDKLDSHLFNYPPMALEQGWESTLRMAEIAIENVLTAIELLGSYNKTNAAKVVEREAAIDKYEDKINRFTMGLIRGELTEPQLAQTSKILSCITDLERISDHSMNLTDTATEIFTKKIVFSEEGSHELSVLTDAIYEILDLTMQCFSKNDAEAAKLVEPLEATIDVLCRELKNRHVERLQTGKCTVRLGFVFNDILNNYERIADHCSNLAVCVIQETDKMGAHEISDRAVESPIYRERVHTYHKKYMKRI